MRKREVVQYRVAEATSREQIEQVVQPLLNEGWELVGGLCVIVDEKKKFKFYQALTSLTVEDVE